MITPVRKASVGGSISFAARGRKTKLPHPWKMTPRYNVRFKRWEVRLRAGFINSLDPLCHGYLATDKDHEHTREVELWDNPYIPIINWRTPGQSGDVIPEFFKALGVRDADAGFDISESGSITIDGTPEDESLPPPRQLRAVDFYVSVARASMQSSLAAVDGSASSGLSVDYGVTFDTTRLDQVGSRAWLKQIKKFQPVTTPSLQARLSGQFQDEGEDRILISTLWLLSPPDATGEPDGAWSPYPENNDKGGFWNLRHAARNLPPDNPEPPIRIQTGLAAGFGDIIANQMLSSTNELSQQVSNAVNNTTNEGKFWSI